MSYSVRPDTGQPAFALVRVCPVALEGTNTCTAGAATGERYSVYVRTQFGRIRYGLGLVTYSVCAHTQRLRWFGSAQLQWRIQMHALRIVSYRIVLNCDKDTTRRSWIALHIATDPGPDMHSDLGPEHACGAMIMAPMPSTVENSTECRVARPMRRELPEKALGAPRQAPRESPLLGLLASTPPSQLELAHFRHLSVESIVHTRTHTYQCRASTGHAVCFLSSMLMSTTVRRGDLTLKPLFNDPCTLYQSPTFNALL